MKIKKIIKKDCLPKNQGFTLIELLIVIAIIGIMTSVGLVSLSYSKKQVALKTAQSEVVSAIKLAQSYALQGKMPTSGESICAYTFRFTSNNKYRIDYVKSEPDGSCQEAAAHFFNLVEENILKSGVTQEDFISDGTKLEKVIYFFIPGGTMMSFGYSDDGVTLNLEYNGETTSSIVKINPSGLVTTEN